MDEKASRCLICCKCSVCVCEAYCVPSMELCSVRGLFSLPVSEIRSHFSAQAESCCSFPLYPFTLLAVPVLSERN